MKDCIRIKAPERLRANVTLPASKSLSNRALLIAALCPDAPRPENLSDCDDTNVMLRALDERPEVMDIQAAGTAMRFLTAYLSVTDGRHVLTGTERMQKRPISPLVDALRSLGADIEYIGSEGYPPLSIRGKRLHGGELSLPGNISSQYVSALLMIAPLLEGGLSLRLVGDIVSRPYIDMTISMMRTFGAKAAWTGTDTVGIAEQPYVATPYAVENDWSAASYWYEMMALTPDPDAEVFLHGLTEDSLQGDSRVVLFFQSLGVETHYTPDGVRLKKRPTAVTHVDLNLVEQPDLAQTLVATCCALKVTSRFTGLSNLKIKETDRLSAMTTELAKLGFCLKAAELGALLWDGETVAPQKVPTLDTYDDHRMAMALAPLCLRYGELHINNPAVVTKSYPEYWDDLRRASFHIHNL